MSTGYRYALISIMCICTLYDMAQNKPIDSLQQRIYIAGNDIQKLEAIIELCAEYKSINRDTLDHYAFMARELASHTNDQRLKDLAELCVAYDYLRWGWRDSAIYTVRPILQNNKVTHIEQRALYFKASRVKAMAYAMHSYYQEALSILYQLVSEAEAYKDSVTTGENINSIGSIALARNQPKEALVWLSRASMLSQPSPAFNSIRAAIYVNTAEAYMQLKKIDSAIYYIDKGVQLFKETGNLSNLGTALQRKSAIYIQARRQGEAEAALKEMIAVRQQSGDGSMFVDDNLSLVEFYMQTNQVDKGIQLCKTMLAKGNFNGAPPNDLKTFTGSIHIRLSYYEALATCYKIKGESLLYQQTLEQIIAAKDSFYQHNSAHAIAELQTKYEVQKKENTIIQQKLDITKENNRFYALLGSAFFIAIIAWLLFTGYRKREKLRLNMMLEKEKSIAAQSVARAEENERKRIAADLHDNLGAYAASIVSNLDFIEPKTEAPESNSAIQELRNNSQAIVSQLNDTIWALKKDALSLTAISDRIKIFIQRIQRSYPHIVINTIEKIENDFLLSPSHAFHLFRIAQESVNNALRHSRAKEITVTIESTADTWKTLIADDGTGIKKENSNQSGGNGLNHMKERAAEAGWRIEWLNNPTGGTTVAISPATIN
ncbi:MAG: hypothetical protein KF746_01180 [Chitinophagaceae bacterium]|nr:hypothetical protein [Chitinophagaceae bacterium]